MTDARDNPNAKLPYPRQRLTPTMVQEFTRRFETRRRFMLALPYVGLILIPIVGLLFLIVGRPEVVCFAVSLLPVIMLVAVTMTHAHTLNAVRRKIQTERLCLNCCYCLKHQSTNEDGIGTCPECGNPFDLKLYESS